MIAAGPLRTTGAAEAPVFFGARSVAAMKQQWRMDSMAELAWRHWDGEYVVHHALSNDTHRLSEFAGDVLLQLAACPAPIGSAALAEALDAEDEEVAATLLALAEVGFVQAC